MSFTCAPSGWPRPEKHNPCMAAGLRRRAGAGFTLLEILVAVAILAIVLLTALSALSAVNRTAAAITETLTAVSGAATAIEQMTGDIQALHVTEATFYRPPGVGDAPDPYRFRCLSTPDDPQDFKRLEFAAWAHRPLAPSALGIAPGALARVTYFVRRIDDRFVLMRTDAPDLRAGLDPPPTPAVVCENVRRLRLRFIDEKGEAHDQWDSDDSQWYYATPRAVEILLEIEGESPAQGYYTRIAPVMKRAARR
jgi:type II secretion system protein J